MQERERKLIEGREQRRREAAERDELRRTWFTSGWTVAPDGSETRDMLGNAVRIYRRGGHWLATFRGRSTRRRYASALEAKSHLAVLLGTPPDDISDLL